DGDRGEIGARMDVDVARRLGGRDQADGEERGGEAEKCLIDHHDGSVSLFQIDIAREFPARRWRASGGASTALFPRVKRKIATVPRLIRARSADRSGRSWCAIARNRED